MQINKISRNTRLFILISSDIIMLILSFLGAFFIRFDLTIPREYYKDIIYWLPILIIIKLGVFIFGRIYKRVYRYTGLYDFFDIWRFALASSAILVIIFRIFRGFQEFPRSVFLMDFLLTSLFLCFTRIVIRIYFSKFHNLDTKTLSGNKTKLVLIGAGDAGEKIVREITQLNNPNYSIIGILDDNIDRIGATIHGVKILGPVEHIKDLMLPYDEILIALPSASISQMRRIIKFCKIPKKPIKTLPTLNEIIDQRILLESIKDFSYLDLLGRDEVKLNTDSILEFITGKRILITGGGGSIGSELARQILKFNPSLLLLLDNNELNCFQMKQELENKNNNHCKVILGDIRDKVAIKKIFAVYKPEIVFHAAAYKHVPILNESPREAVRTNVAGTLNMIELTIEYGVNKFVLVSTDKAVNPTSIMGMTKRIAELIIQAADHNSSSSFLAVRFGNVLGSSGSVIPIFQKQIRNRQPVTITHPQMKRYFMSIPEAAQLIIQAGSLGQHGEIFVLNMGIQVNIKELAYDLITLSGLRPKIDIPIEYIGIRPGEKLEEELFIDGEYIDTSHSKIMILKNGKYAVNWENFISKINHIIDTADSFDDKLIHDSLQAIILDISE
ncbi:SDR family NAD(P)-dependent oxidoreductase [Candidatus Neomarinimicrobiota bacterium]